MKNLNNVPLGCSYRGSQRECYLAGGAIAACTGNPVICSYEGREVKCDLKKKADLELGESKKLALRLNTCGLAIAVN